MTRPLAGVLLDRLGRRGVFLSGLALVTVASAAMYFFPLVGMILLLRFIHGLGWGVATTASSTVAADYIPKARFGEGMGYFSLAASMAMAISPAIALSLRAGPMFILATAFMVGSTLLALFLQYRPVAPPSGGPTSRNPYEKAAIPPAVVMFLVNTAYGAVVTFLAILELYKRVMVRLEQDELFGDIAIDYIENSGDLRLEGDDALTSVGEE